MDYKKQSILAVQLSNRNIMIVDLNAQVYSTQTKQDLLAKQEEFDVVERESLSTEKIKGMSQQDITKIKENLNKDKLVLMDIKFELLGGSYHNGAISEVYTSQQRPVLLTCSVADQTVRLWNYITGTCDLVKDFTKRHGNNLLTPLRCCALHPSGYYMAVALTDKLQLYHLMHREIRLFHSYDQKGILVLKFSAGGHELWAVDSKSIIVYSTFSLERIRVL